MKIGIDIGGNHIAVGIVENDKVLKVKEYEIGNLVKNNSEDIIRKHILDTIKNEIFTLESCNNLIEKIGISCCGTILNGMILKAPNLKIYNFNLIEELKKEFPYIEINLKNDAKCAAIAEKAFGVLQKYDNSIFLTIGTGIGGACFWNNKLLEPKRYSGFEFGHTVIAVDGKLCSCGVKGCFENYASMTALKEMIKEKFNLKNEMTGRELYEFINKNIKDIEHKDKIEEVLESYSKYLALGISNLINIFEPETIVLGGSVVYYKDFILDRIQKKLIVYNGDQETQNVQMAILGNDAGIIGAVI